jgi:hypothetical protein
MVEWNGDGALNTVPFPLFQGGRMNKSTEWYRENKHIPELREKYNERQRKWYRDNIEFARAKAREQQERRRKSKPEEMKEIAERARLKRGKRNRRFVDAYKAFFGCRRCGEGDPICLDLHHRNPLEKEFAISAYTFRATFYGLAIELEKCEVVCSNCHRKIHNERQIG